MATPDPIQPRNGDAKRWVPIAALIMNSLLLPAWGWVATEIIDLRKWQSSVDASSFTARDGQVVYQEIAKITAEMAKLPKETPPAWFMDQFRQVQTKLDRMDERLHIIETKVK